MELIMKKFKNKTTFFLSLYTLQVIILITICIILSITAKQILDTPYKNSIISCKSSGSVWYFYKFKKSDIGKTLRIQIKPYYNDNSCYITEMYVCM